MNFQVVCSLSGIGVSCFFIGPAVNRRNRLRKIPTGRRPLSPCADEQHRQLHAGGDADHGAALGRAVQLGQDHAVDCGELPEFLGLHQGVLAGGGVEDQPGLGRLARGDLVDDRVIFSSSRIRLSLLCMRPAVSMISRSKSRLCQDCMALNTTEPGSAPRSPPMTGMPSFSPHSASWVEPAARKVSAAASSTLRPRFWK